MLYRSLGKTGVTLSIVGFGGIVVANVPQREANEAVARAVARGINYFDVAPSYDDAEERLGPALEPYRNQVFLACKSTRRTGAQLRAELEQSLTRLRTDHFDLYQLHAMTTEEDFQQAMGPGGALEAILAAKEQGLVRHVGFSAHSQEIALKLLDAFAFDTILFPVNWVNCIVAGFGPAVVQKANEMGMGVLALKGMARSRWESDEERGHFPKCWYMPCHEPAEAELAFRYTLSQPITAALPPGDPRLYWMGVDFAERFTPLTAAEMSEVEARARGYSPIFTLQH